MDADLDDLLLGETGEVLTLGLDGEVEAVGGGERLCGEALPGSLRETACLEEGLLGGIDGGAGPGGEAGFKRGGWRSGGRMGLGEPLIRPY